MVEEGATITGNIDLRDRGKVEGVFVCKRCTFAGSILAPHVVFERGIDLSGSTLERALRLEGARFNEAAIFGASGAGTSGETVFGGAVDLAFATFDDVAVFRHTSFAKEADFTSARFRSLARFGEANFNGNAFFEEAIFSRDAAFSGGSFEKEGRFNGAAFGGVSDFRQVTFGRSTTFNGAVFRGRAEFSRAGILGDARFDDSRFAADALFVDTEFFADRAFLAEDAPVVSFNHATIRGRLDFARATLEGPAEFRDASITSLSLEEIKHGSSSDFITERLAASDVSLDLDDIKHISGSPEDQRRILARAEATAKARGNLRLANDLRYRLQVLASQDDPLPRRLADVVLYRYVAGYFVRPIRPLIWLLGLVLLAAFLRALRIQPGGWKLERVVRVGRLYIDALAYTVTPRGRDQTPPLRRLELGAYAALLTCFLLALANTNATLREMVEAVV